MFCICRVGRNYCGIAMSAMIQSGPSLLRESVTSLAPEVIILQLWFPFKVFYVSISTIMTRVIERCTSLAVGLLLSYGDFISYSGSVKYDHWRQLGNTLDHNSSNLLSHLLVSDTSIASDNSELFWSRACQAIRRYT